jgi:Na+-transporting NADH:ubiquinone oxidoreductase subunit D
MGLVMDWGTVLSLIAVGVVREVFGKGSLFAGSPIEMKIIGPTAEYFINTTDSVMFGWYVNNNLMVLPAAAMFIIGIMIWIQRSYNSKLVDIS